MTETALDIKKLSADVQKLQDRLNSNVIGQERAIKQIIKAYTPMTVNMNRPGRPLGVFLFMGPTGVGKTETVRSFAKQLLGSRDAITRIDCAEYGESHEVLKLTGAPPSYLGYGDEPLLSQARLDKYHTAQKKINILLFDEIEKAHPRLKDAIMTILCDGRLRLGSGKETDFSQTFIFLTTNLGGKEMSKMIEGAGIGFTRSEVEKQEMDDKLYRNSKEAVKKAFRPEFVNRLDSIVVFRPLSRESLQKILRIELEDLQWRIWSAPFRGFNISAGLPMPKSQSIVFHTTTAANEFLLDEGTSAIYGARELNRAIDRYVGFPMASLIASEQVKVGDRVKITHLKGEKDLTFTNLGTL